MSARISRRLLSLKRGDDATGFRHVHTGEPLLADRPRAPSLPIVLIDAG
jgi:hypothetical protein